MTLRELGEFGLIEHLSMRLARRGGVILGVGDDAAVLASLRAPIVTTDELVEGVHFRRDWMAPRALGRKAMTVNVSDVAAMGARPVAAFVNLALSTPLLESSDALLWLEELYAGFEDAAREYDFTVAGGDTARAPHEISIGITLIGEGSTNDAGASTPVLRSGARAGDAVIVTGTLGDSAAGLFLLQHPEIATDAATREYLLRRQCEPIARLKEMQAALSVLDGQGNRAVAAGLDLSDGLAGDAGHIARRSGIGVEIELAHLPLSEYARHFAQEASREAGALGLAVNATDWALRGGEDYELLLCCRAECASDLCAAITAQTSTPATIVGRCVERSDQVQNDSVVLIHPDGRREIATGAWRHF